MSKRITYLFNNKNRVTENPLATSEPNNFESTKFGDNGFSRAVDARRAEEKHDASRAAASL